MYDYQYMYVNAWGHLQEVDEDVDIDVDVAAAAETGTGKHDDTHVGKEIRHCIGIYAHTKRDAVTAVGIDSNVDADIDIFTHTCKNVYQNMLLLKLELMAHVLAVKPF